VSAKFPKRKVPAKPTPATPTVDKEEATAPQAEATPAPTNPDMQPLTGNGEELNEQGEPIRTRPKGLMGRRSQRGKDQRILDMVQMVKLLKRGWTKRDIADYFGVTVTTIDKDWKLILTQLKEDRADEAQSLLEIKLAEYSEIKREAWAAWEESKRDAVKVTRETYTLPPKRPRLTDTRQQRETVDGITGYRNGPSLLPGEQPEGQADPLTATGDADSKPQGAPRRRGKVSKTREGRVGDPSHLKTILTCLEAERVLLALDPKRDVNINANVVNWDVLAGGIPDGPVPDVIEREIQRAALGYLDTTASPMPTTALEEGIVTEEGLNDSPPPV
jgi:hypothetical protein